MARTVLGVCGKLTEKKVRRPEYSRILIVQRSDLNADTL